MAEKLVSIIIVTWNGKKHLQKCLSSVFQQRYKHFEVIVVDNNSTDGSIEYIKKYFPHVKLILNKENFGFAQANNIGYRYARGEFILFLNNDTKVTPTFLLELVKVLEKDKSIAGVQSKIHFMDDPKLLDTVGSYFTPTGFLYHYGFAKLDGKKYREQINIYSAKGAAMLFRKNVLDKVRVNNEIYDSRYFAYFEETDLCHRVWLAGYRIVFCPISKIYHKVGATSSTLDNSFVQYHSFKNRIDSYIKNLGVNNLFKILTVHLILCEGIAVMYLFRKKLNMTWAIQKAIMWNIINLRHTLHKRQFIQSSLRALSDERFFPLISKTVPLSYYVYTFFGGLKNYKEKISE